MIQKTDFLVIGSGIAGLSYVVKMVVENGPESIRELVDQGRGLIKPVRENLTLPWAGKGGIQPNALFMPMI